MQPSKRGGRCCISWRRPLERSAGDRAGCPHCPGPGDPPPTDGDGPAGPTVVVNGGDIPGWYVGSYISHLDWINRPQGTGGIPTGVLDVNSLLADYHTAGGGGVHQNNEENINCLSVSVCVFIPTNYALHISSIF